MLALLAKGWSHVLIPISRFVLAAFLLRVVSKQGSYAYLDTLGVALPAISILNLLSVPAIVRVRSVGASFAKESNFEDLRNIVFSDCRLIFWQSTVVGVAICLILAVLGPLRGDQVLLFLWVIMAASASISLSSMEHVAGHMGFTVRIRNIEFASFLLIALFSLYLNSSGLAICATYFSATIARVLVGNVPVIGIFKIFSPFKLSVADFSRYWRWCVGLGRFVMGANALQAFSSFLIYGLAIGMLAPGTVGQIGLAYRFAGPIQVVSSQLSYSTWRRQDIRSAYATLLVIGLGAAIFSLLLPHVLVDFLGVWASTGMEFVGVVAVTHLIIQGLCQIKGATLYSSGDHVGLFFAALPHLLSGCVFLIYVWIGGAVSVLGLVLWLAFPSLIEYHLLGKRVD